MANRRKGAIMAIPQDLSDLLLALESDKQAVATRSSDLEARTAEAAAAAAASTTATTDLDAAKQQLAADLATTIAKLTATYGT